MITQTTVRYAEWEIPTEYTEAAQKALVEYPSIRQASISDHRHASGRLIVIFDAPPGSGGNRIEAQSKSGAPKNEKVKVVFAEKVEHNRPLPEVAEKLLFAAKKQLEDYAQGIAPAVVLSILEGEKTDVTVISEPYVCDKRGRIHKYVSVQDHPLTGTVVYEKRWERCPAARPSIIKEAYGE